MIFVQDLTEVRHYFAEYFFIFVLTNVAVFVIYLAWRLSCRPTLAYNVHLVQTYQSDTQQRVQIINADPERVNAGDLVNLITDENSLSETVSDNPSSNYCLRIRALVVRSPARNSEAQNNLSEDTTIIQLPLNTNRHISDIYQTIQHYTDPSIAGAVVVSLFRGFSRRLSNQNHLQISQLLSEVGSNTEIAASARDQFAFTVNIGEGDETISTDSSTISSAMSSPDDSAALFSDSTMMSSNNFLPDGSASPTLSTNTSNQSGPTSTASEGNEQIIKLKFLDDTEKIVKTKLSATILEFKKAHFASQVSSGKTIRLIFRGQLLRDDSRSLNSYGLQGNCIVHCHINNKPYSQSTTSNTNSNNSSNASEQASYIPNQIPPRPVFDEVANESWLMRIFRMGIYYADVIPFAAFYVFTYWLTWIQGVENVPNDPNASFFVRQVTRVRRWLLAIMRVFIDSTDQSNANEDMFSNRINLGILFTLLFAVKFMSIWFVVISFPQYFETKSVFILLVLTVFFGLYSFQNRFNQQQGNNELRIQ